MRRGRVAYLLTAFPTVTETFVEGEFRALMARGIPVDLYATRNFRQEAGPEDRHSDRGLEIQRSAYLWSGEVAAAVAHFLFRHPLRTLGAFFAVVAGNLASPRFLGHTLALFPKSLVFARRMQSRDTVHVHATWGHYPATCAFIISRSLNIPFSFSAHAGLDVSADTTFQSAKIRSARFVLTCNEANRRLLEDRNPDAAAKIRTIYHGTDLSAIPAFGSVPRASPPEVLSVGRLAPEKGFLDLVAACAQLRQKGIDFRLRIFGEGPERDRIVREIQERGMKGVVTLEGTASHRRILEACARATVVALASYRGPGRFLDGIANVLVEALACGTPVVSTDYPGSRELLQDGRLGLLVPQRNPAGLAEALEALLRDPARRAELADRGRRRIQSDFDREKNVERIASLFREVLQRRAADGASLATSPSASA